MSGFDADWLAQREPFDLAARSRPLEDAFAEALMRRRAARTAPLRLADLGGGTAANFRALAPRLGGDQHWVLLDFDQQLLDQAPARIARWARAQGWEAVESAGRCEVQAGPARWLLETQQIDLAASLEALDATRFDGIVTTAFLDLVSSAWLARFARWLVDADRPLLATLTVDGRRSWHPEAVDDALIDGAFRAHQGGDKGFGESVGPGAGAALADCLRALACPVSLARSDWQIGGHADSAMLDRMADEAVAVALEVDHRAGDRIARWRQTRAAQIALGQAQLVIGHVDLLATPGRPPERDIPDVQGSHDPRNIAIGLVGVKGVRYPLHWGSGPERQAAVGDFTMSVSLPADQKGTHMSRFIAMLEEHSASGEGLDVAGLARMHGQMLERLQAGRGRLEVSLTLFVRKAAPVSGVQSLMDYQLKVVVEGEAQTAVTEVQLVVPVTSLCPCSKTISDYGAHNQRSHVTMWVEARPVIEPQELIRLAEDEASCELWGVLKRADEKYVTERAYDNPKFVEDLIRDVAARLSKDARIGRYAVEVENFESIHNHSAWARIESN